MYIFVVDQMYSIEYVHLKYANLLSPSRKHLVSWNWLFLWSACWLMTGTFSEEFPHAHLRGCNSLATCWTWPVMTDQSIKVCHLTPINVGWRTFGPIGASELLYGTEWSQSSAESSLLPSSLSATKFYSAHFQGSRLGACSTLPTELKKSLEHGAPSYWFV